MRKNVLYFPLIVVIVIVLAYGFRIAKTQQTQQTVAQIQSEKMAPQITFPTNGDTLLKGHTYTIQWNTGTQGTALFLSNVADQNVGYSASIMDRIYNVTDVNNFSYTIPLEISDGVYVLQIAGLTSDKFYISSK